MLKNGKKATAIIIILIILVAGFLWYRSNAQKNKAIPLGNKSSETASDTSQSDQSAVDNSSNSTADVSADETDVEDANFNAQCENGEWMKITDLSGETSTVSGTLRKVYPDDEASKAFQNYPYYLEGSDKIALTGKDLTKIDNFEDREVEVQGVKSADAKSLEISQIRCAGKETDKNIITQRNKLLDYIAKNINSIAPKKAPYQKWTVDIVDIVDENNVYIEYYDTVEDDENSDVSADTGRKILAEITANSDGSYSAKVLAYWEMGEDDYVLKTGTDKFENVDEVTSFQYDSDAKTWERM
jgi:hypothetical protein